jgi:hypothetical protein
MEAMLERMQRDQQVLDEHNRAPKTRQAIRYALGQWEALMRYLDHSQASIDNNRAEQAYPPDQTGSEELAVYRASTGRQAQRDPLHPRAKL